MEDQIRKDGKRSKQKPTGRGSFELVHNGWFNGFCALAYFQKERKRGYRRRPGGNMEYEKCVL